MASYHTRANPELADPDGCMLLWRGRSFQRAAATRNLTMKNRPEVTFSAPSAARREDSGAV